MRIIYTICYQARLSLDVNAHLKAEEGINVALTGHKYVNRFDKKTGEFTSKQFSLDVMLILAKAHHEITRGRTITVYADVYEDGTVGGFRIEKREHEDPDR